MRGSARALALSRRRLLLAFLLLAGLGSAAGPPPDGGRPRPPAAAPSALCFHGQVPENSPPGTWVRGLRVPLPLLPPGQPLGQWALEGDGASRFVLHLRPAAGAALLRTAERLDREARAGYRLSLRGPSRAVLLLLRVLDRNDHRPRFPPSPLLPLEVDELAPLGSEVARLHALDADEGPNARLTYRAWPDGCGRGQRLFVVPRSGQVLAVGSLLGARRLGLWVSAQDHGLPRPLRSPARRLELAVGRRGRGEGAAPPRRRARALLPAGGPLYKVRVPVAAPLGEPIFTVPDEVYRREAGLRGSWFELLSPATVGAFPVELDRGSGRLYLRQPLQRGGRTEVAVKVHRMDGQGGVGLQFWTAPLKSIEIVPKEISCKNRSPV
ncbi:UNVERIFIED_CONTAM: hypothetical protein K2H54_034244 [Gekko kuhli]